MQRNKFNLNRPHGVPFTRPFFVRTKNDRHGVFESSSYVCPNSSKHSMDTTHRFKDEDHDSIYEYTKGATTVDAGVQEDLYTKETTTQTSKTVLTLDLPLETPRMSPDSLSPKTEYSPRSRQKSKNKELESELLKITESRVSFERKSCILKYLYPAKHETIAEETSRDISDDSLTKAFLDKNRSKTMQTSSTVSTTRSKFLQQTSPLRRLASSDSRNLKSRSCIETTTFQQAYTKENKLKVSNIRNKSSSENEVKPVKYFCDRHVPKSNTDSKPGSPKMRTFMSPTISSEKKNQMKEIEDVTKLISPTRRGRSASPKAKAAKKNSSLRKVPYIDLSSSSIFQSCQELGSNDKLALALKNNLSSTTRSSAMSSCATLLDSKVESETDMNLILIKLKDSDWNTALRGLAEVVECCRITDIDFILPHMTTINQRVIELLKSPRSHVCRTACQAVGHLFEYVKDVRRPEFDEIVDTLLCRTADSNKFIRHDANLALDCMVTHIPILHSVRAICNKAPDHKNPLVRTACARLVVCAAVIAGPHAILHPNTSDYTRKRLILNLVRFLNDKTFETKKYGERLYKLMSTDKMFDFYLKRYLERETIVKIRTLVKCHTPNGKTKAKSPHSPKVIKNDF